MSGHYLLIPSLNGTWWSTIDLEPPGSGKRRSNPIRRTRTLRGALQTVVGDLFRETCPNVDPSQRLKVRPTHSSCPYRERASLLLHRLPDDPRLLVHAKIKWNAPLPPLKGRCDQGCNAKCWSEDAPLEGAGKAKQMLAEGLYV